ncbi:MAG: 50S ribosomal protein L11 methyltransferase, partial [Acetobacteraceae bacterium]
VRERAPVAAAGWLARNRASFPPALVGRRFVVRPTHLPPLRQAGRITLTLDAGLAFGSGEHGSTRGCLLAIERLAPQHPRRILDLGTGSGILAMAAARLWGRRVLATDIEPFSVRVAAENARRNGLGPRITVRLADGWRGHVLRRAGRFDLVLANILARPLCRMARDLSLHLAPGGRVVLAGLLAEQERMVLAAHRRVGLVLAARLSEGAWRTLVLRAGAPPGQPILEGRSPSSEVPKRGSSAGTASR